ncbi:MAG: hypothetical protein KDA57_19570 [Planctomycetales bacterium]|nr:hypothetical protein [Planctomycetales bacterium]
MHPFLRHLGIFFVSVLLLLAAYSDMGFAGVVLFTVVFSTLIFVELMFIRSTLLRVYAAAIARRGLLRTLLQGRLVNIVVAASMSLYLALNLLVYVNLAGYPEFLFIVFAGLLISALSTPLQESVSQVLQEEPAKAVGRFAIILFVALLVATIESGQQILSPIDNRIEAPFDVDIPDYVIHDISHSAKIFQDLLRTSRFLTMNIDSIGLLEEHRVALDILRFILVIQPAPFIAYALLLLSLFAIKRVVIETKR